AGMLAQHRRTADVSGQEGGGRRVPHGAVLREAPFTARGTDDARPKGRHHSRDASRQPGLPVLDGREVRLGGSEREGNSSDGLVKCRMKNAECRIKSAGVAMVVAFDIRHSAFRGGAAAVLERTTSVWGSVTDGGFAAFPRPARISSSSLTVSSPISRIGCAIVVSGGS